MSPFREQINEMLCELYSPSISMPEAPKQNFFVKLFAANAVVDPDQLCKILREDFPPLTHGFPLQLVKQRVKLC